MIKDDDSEGAKKSCFLAEFKSKKREENSPIAFSWWDIFRSFGSVYICMASTFSAPDGIL